MPTHIDFMALPPILNYFNFKDPQFDMYRATYPI